MKRTTFLVATMLAACATAPALAQDTTAGAIKVSSAWARATPKGAPVGGGYFNITNTGTTPDRLVGGTSDVSRRFEVHEMSMDNGVMKMRQMGKGIEIKPGETIEFKPGGYHVMFVGLNKQLVQGEHINATLEFEKAGKVNVDFAIQGIGAQSGGSMPAGMQHGH
jgi:copper(I)-binding protein